FVSSRRPHTRSTRDWSSDVCSSDLVSQWSLDIQRELPFKIFLTVGYVGSQTVHIDNTVSNFNNPDPSPDTDINAHRPRQAYVSQIGRASCRERGGCEREAA